MKLHLYVVISRFSPAAEAPAAFISRRTSCWPHVHCWRHGRPEATTPTSSYDRLSNLKLSGACKRFFGFLATHVVWAIVTCMQAPKHQKLYTHSTSQQSLFLQWCCRIPHCHRGCNLRLCEHLWRTSSHSSVKPRPGYASAIVNTMFFRNKLVKVLITSWEVGLSVLEVLISLHLVVIHYRHYKDSYTFLIESCVS